MGPQDAAIEEAAPIRKAPPRNELTQGLRGPNRQTRYMTFSDFTAGLLKTSEPMLPNDVGAPRTTALRVRMLGALAAWCALGVVACGDDGGGSETQDETGSLSALEEKLAKCPTVQTTSDPTASACLEGTYTGKTFSGETCSLTIGDVGAYTFTSPTVTVGSTPLDDSIFVFGHTLVGDFGQLTWMVSDPLSTETWYDFEFSARYGEMVPANDRKIEIEVQRHDADSMTAVTCTVTY